MLKIAAWNIRGLNSPLKQKEIFSFVQSQRLGLCGIVETKVRREHMSSTVSHCFPPNWDHLSNLDGVGSPARILCSCYLAQKKLTRGCGCGILLGRIK
ncbi:hypothetical protein RHGRI_013228 [Rhododendron griersonianum]|uniref:Uncharacterized protein n=1 Tax=Rhododendron griersonianum TaxID=479676 RepID=A0AAV6K4R2_9ERIC|nr:hypothetical protein RHGRI_013228 [Rhododendron griersonianum]